MGTKWICTEGSFLTRNERNQAQAHTRSRTNANLECACTRCTCLCVRAILLVLRWLSTVGDIADGRGLALTADDHGQTLTAHQSAFNGTRRSWCVGLVTQIHFVIPKREVKGTRSAPVESQTRCGSDALRQTCPLPRTIVFPWCVGAGWSASVRNITHRGNPSLWSQPSVASYSVGMGV